VIELIVDINQEFCPKLKSRMGDDGKFITPELDDMFPFLPREILQEIRLSAEAIT
jgi:acetolactate synthase-1/2/3 large subunit